MRLAALLRPVLISIGLMTLVLVVAACGEAAAPTATQPPAPTNTTAPTDTPAAPVALPGEGKTISPARPTWDTSFFQTEIYIKALEELGYNVEQPITLDNPPFYEAVAQGDVDFWADGWFPLHNTYYEDIQDRVALPGTVAAGGALQGYLVDKATADEHNITSLADFTRPEIKALFDTNSDGKADLVACPAGWGCELVIEHHLDAYELRDHVNSIKAEYSASMADAIARYEAGEPVFFYTWTPNWTVGKLVPGEDVVWLEVPFASLPEEQVELEDTTTVEGVTGCVNDPCQMGWPPNDLKVVANREFLEDNPAAERLFQAMSIPLLDIFEQNARMFEGEDSAQDIQRHAEEWISENQEQFDSWIEEALSAGTAS